VPIICWVHSCRAAVEFAGQLRRAPEAVRAGGVAKNLWLRYSVTMLANDDGCMVENQNGLTLDMVYVRGASEILAE
jgi:hypothetical protein